MIEAFNSAYKRQQLRPGLSAQRPPPPPSRPWLRTDGGGAFADIRLAL